MNQYDGKKVQFESNNNAEGEKKKMEQYNEKKYYDYLNREKTENPWEEKDFSLAFMYL